MNAKHKAEETDEATLKKPAKLQPKLLCHSNADLPKLLIDLLSLMTMNNK